MIVCCFVKDIDISVIIAAIIALAGVALTAFISIYSLNKESYNKRVTEERIRWLNKVREDYSIIMAAYECFASGLSNKNEPRIDKQEYDNRMYEAEKARYDLISRLRTSKYKGNEYNDTIKKILRKMNFTSGNAYIKPEEKEIFISYMNLMLEQEWDKTKKEA